jgi:hypothetical protein
VPVPVRSGFSVPSFKMVSRRCKYCLISFQFAAKIVF